MCQSVSGPHTLLTLLTLISTSLCIPHHGKLAPLLCFFFSLPTPKLYCCSISSLSLFYSLSRFNNILIYVIYWNCLLLNYVLCFCEAKRQDSFSEKPVSTAIRPAQHLDWLCLVKRLLRNKTVGLITFLIGYDFAVRQINRRMNRPTVGKKSSWLLLITLFFFIFSSFCHLFFFSLSEVWWPSFNQENKAVIRWK